MKKPINSKDMMTVIEYFYSIYNNKVKVYEEDYWDAEYPTITIEYPSRNSYAIGYDTTKYSYFTLIGKDIPQTYHEPADFEWIEGKNFDDIGNAIVNVASYEAKILYQDELISIEESEMETFEHFFVDTKDFKILK
jgi:hypothetical protein